MNKEHLGCYSGLAGSPEPADLHRLLRTMLILLARGRFFSGMENQVFLPMITTFCFPATHKRLEAFALVDSPLLHVHRPSPGGRTWSHYQHVTKLTSS